MASPRSKMKASAKAKHKAEESLEFKFSPENTVKTPDIKEDSLENVQNKNGLKITPKVVEAARIIAKDIAKNTGEKVDTVATRVLENMSSTRETVRVAEEIKGDKIEKKPEVNLGVFVKQASRGLE